jgi:hypothetical protein
VVGHLASGGQRESIAGCVEQARTLYKSEVRLGRSFTPLPPSALGSAWKARHHPPSTKTDSASPWSAIGVTLGATGPPSRTNVIAPRVISPSRIAGWGRHTRRQTVWRRWP